MSDKVNKRADVTLEYGQSINIILNRILFRLDLFAHFDLRTKAEIVLCFCTVRIRVNSKHMQLAALVLLSSLLPTLSPIFWHIQLQLLPSPV